MNNERNRFKNVKTSKSKKSADIPIFGEIVDCNKDPDKMNLTLDYEHPILEKKREAEQEELERQETELRRIFVSDSEFYADEISNMEYGDNGISDE